MVVLASRQIGETFSRFQLPLISGFLLAGIFAGPFLLGLVSSNAVEQLRFVDEISLSFIAFAAGSELYVKELRSRLRSIGIVAVGNAIALPLGGSLAVYLLSDFIPFMDNLGGNGRIAVSLLAGAILMARSPSSAIAIINELRAKGPFTSTTLGVTLVTDVLVIVIFAINLEIADALLTGVGLNLGFVLLLIGELSVSLLLGYLTARLLQFILSWRVGSTIKSTAVLALGYGVFVLSTSVRHWSHDVLGLEVLLEPLLICMIGSFIVTNYSRYRDEFTRLLVELSPAIYVIFFTLTGASLALDVLASTWVIALVLFGIRLLGLFIGSFTGGVIAGDPMAHNRFSWLTYVTQAGVGLGLAKEVAVLFPTWGGEFATEMISVIVMSQLIGPPLHKWAIQRMGEARLRADTAAFDGQRDALIFGVEGQANLLARQLEAHGWKVRMACLAPAQLPETAVGDVELVTLADITPEALRAAGADHADALVTLLSDEENYQICEVAYETFGTETMVVRLNDLSYYDQFREIGALIVEPGTAMVGLLDQFVRAPASASLLMGLDTNQELLEIELRDPTLHGRALRDLRLPLDTLVLSIRRNGQTILTHGYTQLEMGDRITVVGTPASLDQVALQFEAYW